MRSGRPLLQRLCDVLARPGVRRTDVDPSLDLHVGLEHVTPADRYSWHGLRRGRDPRHPFVVCQYTLDGFGAYADATGARRVPAGWLFTAVVPSDHHYYLPRESAGWRFFWVIVHHPYVVSRIAAAMRRAGGGPVAELHDAHPVVLKLADLFEATHLRTFRDRFALEGAQFDLLAEYDRSAHHRAYAPPARQRLLDETRQHVLARLDRPVEVEELAARRGMSRTRYSHHFKAATGLAPARYVTHVRLAEVKRRLTESDEALKAIASATGFADANHLCKVFRRHYHLSPGAFRKQMR